MDDPRVLLLISLAFGVVFMCSVPALLTGFIAYRQGRSPLLWMMGSYFFGVFGPVVAIATCPRRGSGRRLDPWATLAIPVAAIAFVMVLRSQAWMLATVGIAVTTIMLLVVRSIVLLALKVVRRR